MEAARPCIVSEDGDRLVVDTDHDAYPRDMTKVGNILAGILKSLWLKPRTGCKCNQRAQEMNARGPDWVEENIDTVSGWLREEARNRGLPYADIVGKALIMQAVTRARHSETGGP